MDARWLLGVIFVIFADALVMLHCPFWACVVAAAAVYILATKLRDEL